MSHTRGRACLSLVGVEDFEEKEHGEEGINP